MTVPQLHLGDRVRFVSPASTPARDAVARGARVLESWGLEVEIAPHAFDEVGYLAGTDRDRLSDFDEAFSDPAVRAVFTTRGGKGSYRIADQIDVAAVRADPKPLVGFSDITYLHLALQRAGAWVGFHGPSVNWAEDGRADPLRRALMSTEPIVVQNDGDAYTAQLGAGEPATGPLIGGNLDCLSRSVGWATPHLDGAILLLEDQHGTGLGQIDRCLHQLTKSRVVDRIAGVAIGSFGEFETSEAAGWTLADVFSHWLDRLNVPVVGGLPIGHSRDAVTVPLGTRTSIDPPSGTMTISPGVY